MFQLIEDTPRNEPWNKGKLVGQKKPLKLKEIWAIRIRLQLAERHRDLALFNLATTAEHSRLLAYSIHHHSVFL